MIKSGVTQDAFCIVRYSSYSWCVGTIKELKSVKMPNGEHSTFIKCDIDVELLDIDTRDMHGPFVTRGVANKVLAHLGPLIRDQGAEFDEAFELVKATTDTVGGEIATKYTTEIAQRHRREREDAVAAFLQTNS